MGNDEPEVRVHQPRPVRPIEVKTYLMTCQNKLALYRNKKIYEIKKKKEEIITALKQNNLDIAKSKMETIMRLEDLIVVYDILTPLCEVLKERITYLLTATEPPVDIKAQLDTLMYASSRIELDDLYKLRHLVQKKYGIYYIQAADQNRDGLVNVNVIEKLRVKPPSNVFLIIRLKQLCKEKKIPFEFPSEIISDIPGDIGNNPFGAPGNNPYGGDFNPYASAQGPNPYGPPPGDNNPNPYGPPPGGNNPNPYGPPPGDNNPNPYGPPPGGNNPNPYGPPPGDNNPNPYGPPPGGNNPNPYGPPPGNSQFGNDQNNPFGGPTVLSSQNPNANNNSAMNSNPYSSNMNDNNNPYSNNNSNNASNNPFAQNSDNPFAGKPDSQIGDGGFPKADNEGGNPYQ